MQKKSGNKSIYYLIFFPLILFVAQPATIPYVEGDARSKKGIRIFDTIGYNGESHLLYTRLWRLDPYVDEFIVLVSNMSHSGKFREVSFAPFENEFKKFSHKLHIYYIDISCSQDEVRRIDHDINWCREKKQRMARYDYLKLFNPQEGDLIISADADEIPTKAAFDYIVKHPPKTYYSLCCTFNSFNFNFYTTEERWCRLGVLRYSSSLTANDFNRQRYQNVEAEDKSMMCTHCTYCFNTAEAYVNKMITFAHQEFNKYPFTNLSYAFYSHYCKVQIPWGRKLIPTPYFKDEQLLPDDLRLRHLIDNSFHLDINKTIYKESDLATLCNPENDWWIEAPKTLKPKYRLK